MPYQIRYDWLARAALDSLPPPERQEVDAAVMRLSGGRPTEAPGVRKLASNGGTEEYQIPAGEAFRVFFSVEPGVITIQDVVNRKFAVRYG